MHEDQAQDREAGGIGKERKCIVTGERKPKHELIRFVIGPDGQPVADIQERLPGRGLWLSAQRDVVNTACAKNIFARAARGKVDVPAGFADRIESLLSRRCMDLIGLSRRAGAAVGGFEIVRTSLANGRTGLLLTASDAGADGRKKMERLAADVPMQSVLTSAELGQALGREAVVHVAIGPGRLADRLMKDLRRLEGFRQGLDDEAAAV